MGATESTQFEGFRPAAPQFFRDLAAHQDRAWFQANRPVYEREVLAPLRGLVAVLASDLPRRGVPLTADPLKAVFRIHRDVRFARDKRPYKTHAGAILSRDGTKDGFGILYIHIDPQGSFAAAGFWQPAPPALEAMRQAMLEQPGRLRAALDALAAAHAVLRREDALRRLPRGFEAAAGGPVADYVKLRHLIAHRPVAAADLADPALPAKLAEFAAAALPLLRFGWEAVD